MPNVLLTPQKIGNQALANLYATTLMAGLVYRDYSTEFTGKQGDTVTIRKPTKFAANVFNRATGTVVQNATETGIPVVLNRWIDVSFAVTSEELTLTLVDFNEQLLAPAMEAVVQQIDQDILSLRGDITHTVGTTAGELWSSSKSMAAAGRVLDQNLVGEVGRSAVVGPITATEWIKEDLLNRFDARGDTEGRRNRSLGDQLFGFDPFKTNQIVMPAQTSGNSTTEVGVGFHRTAFALVTRPLALPMGNANATYVQYKGFALRVIISWDPNQREDVVTIDTLYGVKTMDPNRACLIMGALNP